MTTQPTIEQTLKAEIKRLIVDMKCYEAQDMPRAAEALRNRLQWLYAELANEQGTTYPTL